VEISGRQYRRCRRYCEVRALSWRRLESLSNCISFSSHSRELSCAYRKSNPTFRRLHLQDLPLILLTNF